MRHATIGIFERLFIASTRGFRSFRIGQPDRELEAGEFGVASQCISRTAMGISREDRDRHKYMMRFQRESSDTVFLGVVTERAIGHFQKVGSTDANAAGTLERGQQVTALKIANLLLEIYAALGNQHLFA